MSSFEHSRFGIIAPHQHILRHTLEDFSYNNPAVVGDVTTVQGALDWLFAVLYPQSKPAVATPGDLPLVGNTLNDMRVVEDDGDGKAASYRWERREGDPAAKWYKIYDMDWGSDSILEAYQLRTQDLYVMRQGYDDLDADGNVVTGSLAGQSIYGGKTAGSNLTFFANSGDGTGPATGFVQLGDNVRPLTNATLSLGTSSFRFSSVHSVEFRTSNLVLSNGSITDSSGSISFGDENLTTTGSVSGNVFTGAATGSSFAGTTSFGTLSLASGSITDSSGSISFDNENLTTTGTLAGASATLSTLVLASGSITDTTGEISFGNENLTTTGSFTAAQVNVDSLRLDGSSLSVTALNTSLVLQANGTGVVDVQSAMTSLGITATGIVSVTGQLNADNLRLDANTVSSTDTNGNITLSPNGSGFVEVSSSLLPVTDSAQDLGASSKVWNKLWLDGSIGFGLNEITVSTLLSFRSALSGASPGMALFYDGSVWVPSFPDTEVDHGTISGLGDDDHSQYALLAGRSGGQSLTGGTAASNNLTLDSTSHSTKGSVILGSSIRPSSDAVYSGGWSGLDLGSSLFRFNNVYTAGEFLGFRLENLSGLPSSSSQRSGRLLFNTADRKVYMDTGLAIEKVGANRFETDTSWNGVISSLSVTVSGVDATRAIWQLKDNTNNYEVMAVKLTSTSSTNLTITANAPLPAGSYRLIGIE